jgi:uncharacterized RDD family membrane protein YckC
MKKFLPLVQISSFVFSINCTLMSNVSIETTQNVSLDYVTANAGDRLLEGLIDLVICLIYFAGSATIVNNIFHDHNQSIIIQISALIPVIFYSLYMEIFFNGQTIGKKIMKTKVIMLDGSQPSIGSYLIRWLFRLIDVWIIGFPGVVGMVIIVAGNKGQRLGDMLAGTTVIKINQKIGLEDTLYHSQESGYEIQFPQVAQLTDQQLGLIKEALSVFRNDHNYFVVKTLSEKLKTLLQIETKIGHVEFLEILLKDYAHISDKPAYGNYRF